MRGLTLLVVAVAAVVAPACASFNPDLGPTPFLCGTDSPRCPDGYDAIDVTAVRCECHKSVSTSGGDYNCNNDVEEPNNQLTTATATAGVGTPTVYNNLAVCPSSDVDFFSMNVTQVGTTFTVQVDFDATRDVPALDILDASGSSIHPSISMSGTSRVIAMGTTSSTGRYYASVKAGGTDNPEVNYSVRLQAQLP